jgi:hypothetical protein
VEEEVREEEVERGYGKSWCRTVMGRSHFQVVFENLFKRVVMGSA